MVSSNNYFDKILTESNKLNKQEKDKPEDDDAILTAYLLQLRAANWFANNPGSVLLNSAKYSGCKSSTGNKEPLGGPIDEIKQNYRNRQGSTFCSDEYPFWECPNKKKKSVTIVKEKEIKENKKVEMEIDEKEIEEIKENTKIVKKIEEKEKPENDKEQFADNFSDQTKTNIMSVSAIIIFFLFIFAMSYLIAFD